MFEILRDLVLRGQLTLSLKLFVGLSYFRASLEDRHTRFNRPLSLPPQFAYLGSALTAVTKPTPTAERAEHARVIYGIC